MMSLDKSAILCVALLSVSLAACDLVQPALPCRTGADCGAAQECSIEGRCVAAQAIDAGRVPAPEAEPDDDSGTLLDAGGLTDGGLLVDGGEVSDAGPIDGGRPLDGGRLPDGGPPRDGGVDAGGPPADGGGLPDAGPRLDGGFDAGPLVDGGAPPFDAGFPVGTLAEAMGFSLSTIDATSIVVEASPEAWLLGDCADAVVTFDSTTQTFLPAECGVPSDQVVLVPNLNGVGMVATIVANTIDVDSQKTLRLVGDHPVALVSLTSLTIDGEIDASGASQKRTTPTDQNVEQAGAGAQNALVCASANGGAGGETGINEGHGGGGAGHATQGAVGGETNRNGASGNGGVGGDAIATAGLRGGCRGGNGSGDQDVEADRGQGGAGGGAVHLVGVDNVTGSGAVTVAGAAGTHPRRKKLGGGGGGSGGTLMVTSGALLFMGNITVIATGGGGGSGEEDMENKSGSGLEGRPSALVPLGGGLLTSSKVSEGGRGGVGGGVWSPTDGEDGPGNDKTGGGGGGGAAGVIMIETATDRQPGDCVLPSVAAPALSTAPAHCAVGPVCGNGVQEQGEECDLGSFNLQGDITPCGCSATCTERLCESVDDAAPNDPAVEACADGETCNSTPNRARTVQACEGGADCTLQCSGGRDRCDVLCASGATCRMRCVDTVEVCMMLCAPGASCDILECSGANADCRIYGTTQTPSLDAVLDD